jgi:tRNA A37 threonylcarbamoyladenosine biosynthesis protein TsaE
VIIRTQPVTVTSSRLDTAELEEIGMDPELAESGVVAVEWAERLSRRVRGAVEITLTDTGGDGRAITVVADGP